MRIGREGGTMMAQAAAALLSVARRRLRWEALVPRCYGSRSPGRRHLPTAGKKGLIS
jgi:hypothetical protein